MEFNPDFITEYNEIEKKGKDVILSITYLHHILLYKN